MFYTSPLSLYSGRGVGGEGEKVLPSGRSVAIRVANDQEELEVRSPEGEVEVRITLTAEGPVVHLRSARLQLEATDEVKVQCRKFEVHSTEGTELKSDGNVNISAQADVNVQTGQDTRINGRMIYLN